MNSGLIPAPRRPQAIELIRALARPRIPPTLFSRQATQTIAMGICPQHPATRIRRADPRGLGGCISEPWRRLRLRYGQPPHLQMRHIRRSLQRGKRTIWFYGADGQKLATYTIVRSSKGATAKTYDFSQPNDNPYSGVIYYGVGTYDWLDTPGMAESTMIYSTFLTYSFTSSLTNEYTDASCSVSWSFRLSVIGNKWSINNIIQE